MLSSLSGSFPHFDRVDPIGTGSFMHKLNYFVKCYEIFPLKSQNKSFFLFSYIFRQFLKHFVLLKVNYYFWFSNKKQFVTNMFCSFFVVFVAFHCWNFKSVLSVAEWNETKYSAWLKNFIFCFKYTNATYLWHSGKSVDAQPMNGGHAEKGQPLYINTSKSEKFIFLLYRIKDKKGLCLSKNIEISERQQVDIGLCYVCGFVK